MVPGTPDDPDSEHARGSGPGSLGYNTAEYIHLLSQVIDLAMSDSHRYVADPHVVEMPEALYSRSMPSSEPP